MSENCNMDKVKARIRKLLAIAADDTTIDGEITTAMKLAEEAMEKYHLDRADVEASDQARSAPHVETMNRSSTCSLYVRRTTWEGILGRAIETLLGSVGCYWENKTTEVGTFRRHDWRHCMSFFGPAEDVALASDLYSEWVHVIAALAAGKYGSPCRGDGLQYADGFACGLLDVARKEAAARKTIVTPSTTAIVKVGTGSLADVLSQKKSLAESWLRNQGIFLHSQSTKRASRTGSWDAKEEGRRDGRSASFTASRKAKLTN